jgi:O-antigen/teichoic acid export membrane protein
MKASKKIDYSKVPSTKRMAGDTLWNLLGSGLPIIFGLIAFPIMLNEQYGFGKERLELIGVVWMLVGFSGILDMGLGRALTKLYAEKLSRNDINGLPKLFWTSLGVTALIGFVVGIITILFAIEPITGDLHGELKLQARHSLIAIGLTMPMIILNVGLQGVLQASRKFMLLNIFRVIFGSYTFISPLLVLFFTKSIFAVVLILLGGRAVETIVYLIGCAQSNPALKSNITLSVRELKPLFGFGGWMTVSNVAVSLMTHINRFIIRTLEKIGEGTYYFVPEELVVRLLIIPRAWIDVLFPALVTSFTNSDNDKSDLFGIGLKYLLLVMLPASLLVAVFAPSIFAVWLPEGEVFALKSALILKCLIIGVFIHSLARFIWYFIQAAGRPDLVARLHLAELPLYLAAAYFLIQQYGIDGAAVAWMLRASIDFILLLIISAKFLNKVRDIFTTVSILTSAAILLLAAASYSNLLALRLAIATFGLGAYYYLAWQFMLSQLERNDLADIYQHLLGLLRRK